MKFECSMAGLSPRAPPLVLPELPAPDELERYRLVPELDAYVLSYEVGVAKPHPTMYRLACAELGCAPAETVFVGDSRRCDFDGPQAFGMQARWLDRRGGQSLVDALAGIL